MTVWVLRSAGEPMWLCARSEGWDTTARLGDALQLARRVDAESIAVLTKTDYGGEFSVESQEVDL